MHAQNLDPTSSKADVELNLALQKAGLVAPAGASDDVKARYAKFQLDHMVTDEGSNMSAGERQLLALCRALVKNSRIIVLVCPRRRLQAVFCETRLTALCSLPG